MIMRETLTKVMDTTMVCAAINAEELYKALLHSKKYIVCWDNDERTKIRIGKIMHNGKMWMEVLDARYNAAGWCIADEGAVFHTKEEAEAYRSKHYGKLYKGEDIDELLPIIPSVFQMDKEGNALFSVCSL